MTEKGEAFAIDLDADIRVKGRRSGVDQTWDLSISSSYRLTLPALKAHVVAQMKRAQSRLEALQKLHDVLEKQTWQSIQKDT
jgi:hypothetical protein